MGGLFHRFGNIKGHAMTEWSTVIKSKEQAKSYDYNNYFKEKGEAFMLWFEQLMNSLSIMASYQLPTLPIWEDAKIFIDAGGGNGLITQAICKAHPHLTGLVGELEAVKASYEKKIPEAERDRV
jgi:hypothetical protein